MESEEQYVLHWMPAWVPYVAPRTRRVCQVLEHQPVLQLLLQLRCAFGFCQGVDVRSWKHEGGFLTGRPLMLEGKGEVGGGVLPGVCTDVCLRAFHRGKQEGDGEGSRKMSVTDPSLRLFKRDGG